MYRVLKHNGFCVSFYGSPQADKFIAAYKAAGFRIVGHIAFPSATHRARAFCATSMNARICLPRVIRLIPKKPSATLSTGRNSGNRLHPTQKPLSVLLPLVETFSKAGGTVLDPFAGSGSTLLAARMLGRNFIGVELEAVYHRVAGARLECAQPG